MLAGRSKTVLIDGEYGPPTAVMDIRNTRCTSRRIAWRVHEKGRNMRRTRSQRDLGLTLTLCEAKPYCPMNCSLHSPAVPYHNSSTHPFASKSPNSPGQPLFLATMKNRNKTTEFPVVRFYLMSFDAIGLQTERVTPFYSISKARINKIVQKDEGLTKLHRQHPSSSVRRCESLFMIHN